MKLTNEHRHVAVPMPDGRKVEGIVQVRGIDARVHGRGIVLERRRPVAVIVRTRDTLRRLAIDDPPRNDAWLAAAVPLAAFAIRRLLTHKKEAA